MLNTIRVTTYINTQHPNHYVLSEKNTLFPFVNYRFIYLNIVLVRDYNGASYPSQNGISV
ncbi:hypothetical protein HanXRQr2_Chr01g0021951 [Helianthus annuus]|uniref:Uncharacterized protein n=1 Tax=Helianthus annuus TaxID=4232 RepID=A0A9K3JV37_HELAN|nr:hypothetical protein HanXRQr2_Chr01g0021951 [Helianthus annuus]